MARYGRVTELNDTKNLLGAGEEEALPEFVPYNDNDDDNNDNNDDTSNDDTSEQTPRGPGGRPLKVEHVDLLKNENAAAHRTDMYRLDDLVIRRGAPVKMRITFDRPVTPQDNFQVQFRIGAHPNALRKSLVSLSFTGLKSSGTWSATTSQQGASLLLEVTPEPDAVVGKYLVVVGVALANGLQYTPPALRRPLYVLFNAFHRDDVVYLENQSDASMYVMNDNGFIHLGNFPSYITKPWTYGQFDAGVLDACIFIMDRSQLPIADRGDAVKVCRMASAMINSHDDQGVLVGNWSEDFSLGTRPGVWTGSVEILRKYHNTRAPVSYAQCWVYAGVLNTFLRCLGLAARVVTNFFSAHDNNGNMRTDLVFTEDFQPDTRHTRDSIWNYHCWNEVFMRRSDIPAEFSGWQVIDSTPQETSDGNYRCGPASVKAIKMGKVCFPFDGKFIFAEVNSDIIYHIRDRYGNLTTAFIDKKKVGKKILTEGPNEYTPQDLTLEYKHHEDFEASANEAALAMAESYGCGRDHTVVPPAPLTIAINTEKGYVGSPVEVQADFVNKASAPLQISVTVSVETIYYTGVSAKLVHRERHKLDLPPNDTQQMELSVPPHKYMQALGSQPSLRVTVTAKLPQGKMVSESIEITLEVLRLKLQVSSPLHLGQKAVASVSFVNPLDVALERPHLVLEGSGLIQFTEKYFETLEPRGELRWELDFYPYTPGAKILTVVMVSQNNYMAWGWAKVSVLGAPHWSYGPGRHGRSEDDA